MKWLTNAYRNEAPHIIAELSVGHSARLLITGEPQQANFPDAISVDRLKQMDMVGIYECKDKPYADRS